MGGTHTVNERNTGAVGTTFADTVEVTLEKFRPTNLKALLNHLGSKLVHTILCRVADDMVNGAAAVGGQPMLANMLNAPVAKLAMRDEVDASENFIDAGALLWISNAM
jgi:hypothetical protein